MNKLRHLLLASLLLAIAALAGNAGAQTPTTQHQVPRSGTAGASQSTSPRPAGSSAAPSVKPVTGHAPGEQFYIVSSVDPSKQELLLKEPKEVTLLMKVSDATQYADDTGKPIKLSDLRAGATVWVTSSGSKGEPTALRIREGQMTVAHLHRYYLNYPEIK